MVATACSRPKLCLFYLLMLSLYLAGPQCDAFKLRRKAVSGKSSAIESKRHQIYFDDDDEDGNSMDDNDSEEVEDLMGLEEDDDKNDDNDIDDDDNEETSREVTSRKKVTQVFQKVRKVKFELPNERKKYLKRHVKGEETDDDDNHDDDKSKEGIFSKVLSLFGSKNKDAVEAPVAAENAKEVPKVVEDTTTTTPSAGKKKRKLKGWRAYVEKLPLGPLLDFISEGQSAEEDDDEPIVNIEVPKNIKPTAQIVEDLKKAVQDKKQEKLNRKKKQTGHPPLPLHEFENLLINIPSFVPNYTKISNFECRYQGQIFERQLRGHKPWTLQMIDSSARITSGLLKGNANQLGDYDMCTNIGTKVKISKQDVVEMRGKYCLAHIDFYAIEEGLKGPLNLIQGKGFVRSTINDPVHFIPRFTTTNWGMCIPSACTNEDAEQMLENFLKPYNCTGLRVQIEVDEDNCYVKEKIDYAEVIEENWEIPVTLLFYSFCIVCTLVATMSDYSKALKLDVLYRVLVKSKTTDEKSTKEEEEKAPIVEHGVLHKILMTFSLKSTFPLLFNVDGSDEEQIMCVHGLKAIGTVLLYVAFKMIPLGRIPFDNRNQMTDLFNNPASIVLRALFLYTDLFLLTSGLLSSYGVVKDIKSKGKIHVLKRMIGRIVRLTPTLLAVLLFYAFIWEYIGSGPQYGDLVYKNSDLCKENYWKNLLFIHNWMPFEDICATHTFQLAIDMQLYLIVTPLLVWLFYKKPLAGLAVYGILHGFSTGARFVDVLESRLSFVLFHGMKLSQIYRTANAAITSTVHRATPYLIGIGLGIVLRDFEKNIKIPRPMVLLSWLSSFLGIAWCFWSPSHLARRSYQYDSEEASQYAAMAPLVFSISVAWIIFACNYGYGSFINRLLGSRPMILLSRLSYSIYLLEFIVFFTFAASARSTDHFTLATLFDMQEIGVLLGAALALTLMLDLPMQNIRRLILGNSEENKESTATVKEKEQEVKVTQTNGNHVVKEEFKEIKEEEPETISPWGDEEEDPYVPAFRRSFESKTEKTRMSPREYFKPNSNLRGNPWMTDNGPPEPPESEEEEDEEELEDEEEILDEPEPVKEPERPVRQRRFKWDIHDD